MKGENTKLQSRIHELEQKVTNVRNISGVGRCFVVFFQKGGGAPIQFQATKHALVKKKIGGQKQGGAPPEIREGFPSPIPTLLDITPNSVMIKAWLC